MALSKARACDNGDEGRALRTGAHRRYRERKFAFGAQVLNLRKRASLTQSALAQQTGVHLRSVQNWEAGESYPKANALQRLIAALLGHGACTAGNERAEAQTLRGLAADGPYGLAAFDAEWFARVLTTPSAASAELISQPDRKAAPAQHARPGATTAIIDWGDAVAAPRLYGRA